jgi:hypothetical protein
MSSEFQSEDQRKKTVGISVEYLKSSGKIERFLRKIFNKRRKETISFPKEWMEGC